MTRVYYKEAVGAFVVFDVTRSSTFEAVSKWKHDLDSKVKLANGNPIPSVLLANKCDQKKDSSNNASLMDNFCKEAGFLGWFETSAKVTHHTHDLDLSGLAFFFIRSPGGPEVTSSNPVRGRASTCAKLGLAGRGKHSLSPVNHSNCRLGKGDMDLKVYHDIFWYFIAITISVTT